MQLHKHTRAPGSIYGGRHSRQHAVTRAPRCTRPAGVRASAATAAATAAGAQQAATTNNLPRDVDEMVAQAVAAVTRADSRRHIVELLNPVNEKEVNFMATDAMDYPCSNMKEFETIVGLTKALLRGLLGPNEGLTVSRIDEGGLDGDLCATVAAAGKRALAVVWPTAEKLKALKVLAEDPAIELLLIVNPLWKTEGTLVSEFGVGPWRAANEAFVATFERSYALTEQRVGAPSSVNLTTGTRYVTGAVLRVVRSYPEPYVAHVVAADGSSQPIGSTAGKPTYKELEGLVDAARAAKLEIFVVARAASSLDREAGIKPEGEDAGSGSGGSSSSSGGSFYTPAEVQAMDPKQVRRLLVGLGLPGAGTPQKLLARASAVAEAVAAGRSLEAGVDEARKLR